MKWLLLVNGREHSRFETVEEATHAFNSYLASLGLAGQACASVALCAMLEEYKPDVNGKMVRQPQREGRR